MTTLQVKNYFLRLNLEQVQDITDGLIENETHIDESSMLQYETNVEDIFDQFRTQGIQVVRPSLSPAERNEYDKASRLLDEIEYLLDAGTNEEVAEKVKQLRVLVLG